MKSGKQTSQHSWIKIGVFFTLGLVSGLMILFGVARIIWHGKFYPGIKIAGITVAGMTREQAKTKILEQTSSYQATFTFNGNNWQTPTSSVEFEIEATLNNAYHYGRRAKISDYLLLLINKETDYPLVLSEGTNEKMMTLMNEIAGVVEIPSEPAVVELVPKEVRVINGTDGLIIDGDRLDQNIKNSYKWLDTKPIEVVTKVSKQKLSDEQVEELKSRAQKLVGKSIEMTLDDEKIKLNDKQIVGFLSTSGEGIIDGSKVREYSEGLSESLNKDPQDAKFAIDGGKVKEFAPGRDGVAVRIQETDVRIQEGIKKLLVSDTKSENVEVAVTRTPPKVTTDKVNKLGIKERIGRGESYYAHSIPNRIYNVELAASRANSALIAPGEEFSFNKVVGEVSGASGYREAYVISGGRTVLGDGGGVCQVSTTLFRGAMSAGLPITERWGHAYRVGYYEQNSKPGIDATVYAPSKDLRFLNDTPGHILVQTINDPKTLHLVVEIYGTSDGRVATVSEPKVWGITSPLPTIYQDDPTLPTGTMKQIDWAASGAKASFEYRVTRNGETLQDKTFSTVYRAWASVYLRGTGN